MDGQPASLDFGLIGHQDTWSKVYDLLNTIRKPELGSLSMEKLKDIFNWIPPRTVFQIEVNSVFEDKVVRGAYIETFISPDQLQPRFFRSMMRKVSEAMDYASRSGIKVVTLGGFTSIVLEGKFSPEHENGEIFFTTGNTLTTAYVVKGVEEACRLHRLDLSEATLLVIGSTGDIGSACVRYFEGKVRKFLLAARKKSALEKQSRELAGTGMDVSFATDIGPFLAEADVIISAASTDKPMFEMGACATHTLVCDVGYPRNIIAGSMEEHNRLWHGGMGQMAGGCRFIPDYSQGFYVYPAPNVSHGCLLESILLALEQRYESFSAGKGAITIDKIEEIWAMAGKHGFVLAPFFNSKGLWTISN